MNFLNNGAGLSLFQDEAYKKFYVDKSMMIDTLYRYLRETNKYVCITRPRRFGKSVCANMIAAFFDESVAQKSKRLFLELEIGKLKNKQEKELKDNKRLPLCWGYQGKKKVIHINLNNVLTEKVKSYQDFYDSLNRRFFSDIKEKYPNLLLDETISIPEALLLTGDSFVFIIDEWDAIFERSFMSDADKQEYLLFLKALLKDQPYVDFAYMTGILPIAKYSSGSPLNMFFEFTSFQDSVFYPWFGLTLNEIENVRDKNGTVTPSMEELSFWYDGYMRCHDGEHIYNPTSVSAALSAGICQSNWTKTGPMDEVKESILHNAQNVREDIIRMVGGENIEIKLTGFSAEKTKVDTRDEILSSMVVYGFLTYYDGKLSIPNHELMLKFQEALSSESLGLKQTIEESKKLLAATLDRKHADVARYIEELHDEKIPFFNYNDENSLACVVTMGYIAAIDRYHVTRENKAGKGYVDFLFEPFRKDDMPIILELKYNRSAKNALKTIHEREYIKRLKGYKRILLVGINYSEKTKKHTCLTEIIDDPV